MFPQNSYLFNEKVYTKLTSEDSLVYLNLLEQIVRRFSTTELIFNPIQK